MMNQNEIFPAGTIVYFCTPYCDYNEGVVLNSIFVQDTPYVEVQGINDTYGKCHVPIDRCFRTAEELLAFVHETADAIYNKYRKEITDVNSLLKFMYTHNVTPAEEYTDWEARRAAKDATKDLLGIELE